MKIIKSRGYNDSLHSLTVHIKNIEDESAFAIIKKNMQNAVVDSKRILKQQGKRFEYKITLD